jgi:hypothetical protein
MACQYQSPCYIIRLINSRFQWVVCQLDTLRACRSSSIAKIRSVLTALPRTLYATYERILSKVDEEASDDLVRILEWVAFAPPHALEELQEIIAIDLCASPLPRYVPDRKPLGMKYFFEICGPFFHVRYYDIEVMSGPTGEKEVLQVLHRSAVSFSHFSVKEFLFSEWLQRHGTLSKYYLEPKSANQHIGESCLAYLIYWKKQRELAQEQWNELVLGWVEFDNFSTAPLYDYAYNNLHKHCLAVGEEGRIIPLAIEWFTILCSQPFRSLYILPFDKSKITSTALIECTERGMAETIRSLLQLDKTNIDKVGGSLRCTALFHAVSNDHVEAAKILLACGANRNTRHEGFPTITSCIAPLRSKM